MVKIDFRKIIGFGNGGYVVSLPRTWVSQNNLKKGDLLAIEKGADELSFSINHNDRKKEEKKITIDASGKAMHRIKTEIVSAYLNNYNSIEIVSESLQNADQIKDILRNLAGVEILAQTSRMILAKDLINIEDISIRNIIKRIDHIVKGMMDDCLKCIEGEDNYESISSRDEDVNRLYYLVMRVVKNGLKDPRVARVLGRNFHDLALDWVTVLRLEKIADRQKRIARYLRKAKLEDNTKKQLKQIYSEIKEKYNEVMKAYYTGNKEIAFDIEATNKDRIEKCNNFLQDNFGCYHADKKGKKARQDCESLAVRCLQVSRITEDLIAMTTSVKYIARRIMDTGIDSTPNDAA